jgi:VPDSG-CTERM motif
VYFGAKQQAKKTKQEKTLKIMNKKLLSLAIVGLIGSSTSLFADPIPYPNSGTENPITYTFTATASGSITAYFAGSTAAYDNELGMLVNGVSTGVIGLDNQSSFLGQSLTLGSVTAGDVLTFVLQNNTLGMNAYSDPTLNVGYDIDGSVGHNHVYSTPYTATSPIIDSIPVGTFVAFEDLQFPNSDFNYNDEDFVFTDVSVTQTTVPDGGMTISMLGMAFAGLGLLRRKA